MQIVEMFADVRCPFAHVGLRRLTAHRDQSAVPFVVRPRAWPLELVNAAPLDPAMIGEKVAALRRSVAPDLFTGFDPARFPATSLPALALEAAARTWGPRAGERAALLLRHALFEEGRDISQLAELAVIADAVGLPVEAAACTADLVLADWADGRRRGVIGSPHFFVAGRDFFCPTLHIAHDGDSLEIDFDQQRFEDFFASCLAA
jgi:predicted DsbA family dithiol-disulfide isomerase